MASHRRVILTFTIEETRFIVWSFGEWTTAELIAVPSTVAIHPFCDSRTCVSVRQWTTRDVTPQLQQLNVTANEVRGGASQLDVGEGVFVNEHETVSR
jgi:hypothetical protein